MTAVTAFGSSVCNYTKGELLIHAANRCLLRPDAHQRGFLGLINFGSGLTPHHGLTYVALGACPHLSACPAQAGPGRRAVCRST